MKLNPLTPSRNLAVWSRTHFFQQNVCGLSAHISAAQTNLVPDSIEIASTSAVRPRRRGLASVLAMLYLVLFSTLAIGFYATTSMSAQISRNEREIIDAQFAAESGMQFMRYQLGSMNIPAKTSNANLFAAVASELGRLMNGSPNMGGGTVQIVNNTIAIPGGSGYVTLDSTRGTRFQATLVQSGSFLTLTIIGRGTGANVTRTVQMQFQRAFRASAIFNYGIASKGKIVTAGASTITGQGDPTKGSILSTNSTDPTPVTIGGKVVSGDISISNPNGNVNYAGASIGGTSNTALIAQDHIHKGVAPPDFPDIDPTEYIQYAVNKYTGGNTLNNAYIPPNTNPRFTGNTTITGVLYIQAPNVVTFAGNATIQGVVVVDPTASLDLSKNQVNFSGNVSASDVKTLPASYGNLRTLTGAFILAPNFTVSFGGNFGTIAGSIIASDINFSGNAGGTVNGSIINLNDVQMDVSGSSAIVIASTGTSNYPTGVTFGQKYTPLPDTYVELP